jgi:hypothetical protein
MTAMSATVSIVAIIAVVSLVPVMLEVAPLMTVRLLSAATLIVLSVVRSGRLRR